MDSEEESCQDVCQEDCCCPADPEDRLLDLRKMTSDEMKDYLEGLFRSRSIAS